MRAGLSAIAASSNITAQWVFEVDSNYWTFGNAITYDSNIYTSKIMSDSFTGIKEKNTRYADRMIPPNTTEFSITGDKADFSPPDFIDEDVLVTLLDDGIKVFAWRFSVKSCDYAYGKFTFTCEDFLQKYLFNNFYPNTELLNSYNGTTAQMEGPDNAVVPQVFGTAYPQLRMIPDSNQWYPVLGAVAGTYTVNKISSPVEFVDQISVYEPPTYTFTQSTISALRVFANDIGSSGANAPFGKSGKLYDMPTEFSNSLTASVTSPADIISYILQVLGVPVAQIDSAGTFAATKATLATLGITYNYCFTTKEDAVKVLCELLESCNCILPRSDVVQLIALEDGVAVKTIDRDNILDLNFSGKIYTDNFDGAYATYYPNVQDGEPSEITIPINGVSATNISAEKVLYKYTTDTQIIQKLSIIDYRRKFLHTGTVSFSSNHSMFEPYLGDRIAISDSLYEDYENVYIDQISISPELAFEFSLDSYSEVIGDLTDYTPSAVTRTTDLSPFVVPFLLDNLLVGTNEADTHLANSAILSGQTAYDTGNGWFLGRSGNFPKFSMRNSTGQYLRFGNNNLETSGLTISGANVPNGGDITVNSGGGIVVEGGGDITVNSGGGVIVQGGGDITVNSGGSVIVENGGDIQLETGGDLKLKSSTTDQAEILFYNSSGSKMVSIGSNNLGTNGFFIDPGGSGQYLKFGAADYWDQIEISADSGTSIYTGVAAYDAWCNVLRADSTTTRVQVGAQSNTRDADIRVEADSAEGYVEIGATHRIELDAGTSIKNILGTYSTEMNDDKITIHRGMLNQALNTATHDSLLTNNGDFYEFTRSGYPYQRYARIRSTSTVVLDQRVC